ncbi:hypothetical protein H5410_022021 [Solanum commersonii]|uniref:Uncharacterized protein n=1 Tax=Solanum commersonii TaxID=4109 RepID=A0A9J5ZGW1_SOLCO|nr:hypothetical protein H5410_022021 [Solanum commersonii]
MMNGEGSFYLHLKRNMIIVCDIAMDVEIALLKVLDIFSIEYDFSCLIPQLVHLRYVSARNEEIYKP